MSDGVGRYDRNRDSRAERRPVPLRAAAGYGVLAGLGTYAMVALFLGVHVLAMPNTTVAGVGANALLSGVLGDFFGSHVGVTDGVVLGVAGVGTVPLVVYYLVPPSLLVCCGWFSASGTTARTEQEAFLQGAGVALGYSLVVGLSLVAMYSRVEFALVGVDPVRVALLGGLVYPLVFGGIGGYTTRIR
jgi:hypothetical protein